MLGCMKCNLQGSKLVLQLDVTVDNPCINFTFLSTNNLLCLCFFDSADEVLLKPTGAQLTVEFLEEHSFSVPVMVLRRDGLGMTLPPSSFSVTDVEHYIGKVFKTFPRKSVYTLSTLYLFHLYETTTKSCFEIVWICSNCRCRQRD